MIEKRLRKLVPNKSNLFSGDFFYYVYLPMFRPPLPVGFIKVMFLIIVRAIYNKQQVSNVTYNDKKTKELNRWEKFGK